MSEIVDRILDKSIAFDPWLRTQPNGMKLCFSGHLCRVSTVIHEGYGLDAGKRELPPRIFAFRDDLRSE